MKNIPARFAVLTSALLLLSGCTPPDPPAQSTEIASQSRQIVFDFVAEARKSPAAAPERLTVLLESLDAQADQHGGVHVQIRDKAKELQALYAGNSSDAEIEAKLTELEALADSISG